MQNMSNIINFRYNWNTNDIEIYLLDRKITSKLIKQTKNY
jgi:hypothetical protein